MKTPTIDDVISATCHVFGVDTDYIKQDTRQLSVSSKRQVAQYMCRTITTDSLQKIGEATGGKRHCTVLYSVGKIAHEYEMGRKYKAFGDVVTVVDRIKKRLNSLGFSTTRPEASYREEVFRLNNGSVIHNIHCHECGRYVAFVGAECSYCNERNYGKRRTA